MQITPVSDAAQWAAAVPAERPDPLAVPTETPISGPPAAAPAAAPVPWMDPRLGGRAAIGRPEDYLPLLLDLEDELAGRQDAVARYGLAAVMDEVRNQHVLSAHLNSLIE